MPGCGHICFHIGKQVEVGGFLVCVCVCARVQQEGGASTVASDKEGASSVRSLDGKIV